MQAPRIKIERNVSLNRELHEYYQKLGCKFVNQSIKIISYSLFVTYYWSFEPRRPRLRRRRQRQSKHSFMFDTLFFYKNVFYKNVEAEICEILSYCTSIKRQNDQCNLFMV